MRWWLGGRSHQDWLLGGLLLPLACLFTSFAMQVHQTLLSFGKWTVLIMWLSAKVTQSCGVSLTLSLACFFSLSLSLSHSLSEFTWWRSFLIAILPKEFRIWSFSELVELISFIIHAQIAINKMRKSRIKIELRHWIFVSKGRVRPSNSYSASELKMAGPNLVFSFLRKTPGSTQKPNE